ncbi:hypothetical protein AB0K09_30860 [Streptomyces sp. NPDC049577]|uniref:hypothetical protein n=1 Tax=Streptomyces sp. NPDC049577 TaxID=3155153 RepID=UPI003424E6F5
MLALSLATVLEEVLASGPEQQKNLQGNIRDLDELLQPENLARLREVADVFAFLAFHPAADAAVTDYVRSGTLADDSGPGVLALFTLDTPAPVPVVVDDGSFSAWLDLGGGTHPAYRMVRTLFADGFVPPLPGVLFFHDLASESGAVYVPLGRAETEDEVRTLLRRVFALAAAEADPDNARKAVDRLCVALRKEHVDYHKTRRASLREWLVEAFQLAAERAGDIVGVVGLLI